MKKNFKKWIFPSLGLLLFSHLSWSAELTQCQISHPVACKDCKSRIQASCTDNRMQGALDSQLKPEKYEIIITNSKTGSERIVILEKTGKSLAEMQELKNIKAALSKAKIKLTDVEKAEISSIWIPTLTKFYSSTTGQNLAGNLTSSIQRNIASDNSGVKIGGIQRALDSQKPQSSPKGGR